MESEESASGGENIGEDTERQRKGEGNYTCGGLRGRDKVRDRDRGRHK